MEKGVDPDQMASSVAISSESTLFAKEDILYSSVLQDMVCLFDLILYVPSTIFQL